MPCQATDLSIVIDLSEQRLTVLKAGTDWRSYVVSTAKNGPGERSGSGCTPRGRHYIRACIGGGQPLGTVFVGRRPTGERYSSALARQYPERDWILSRILWLCGLEPGVNRLGQVDSQRRFIYIHGTPDDQPMGVALSHGCIRMRNSDVVELFDLVRPGTSVTIR